MSDFLVFDEGADKLLNGAQGLPANVKFLLSTRAVGTEAAGQHKAADTYEGGSGEITGTGYAAKEQAVPAAAGTGEGNRALSFSQMVWETTTHEDWQEAKSVVMYDNTAKKKVCAWNLQAGGAGRKLAEKSVEEKVTPTLKV